MTFTRGDLRLLAALAALLRRVDPVPPEVLADATAVGLRLRPGREPRLADQRLDIAWLIPGTPA
ncbi:hypothetical protein [Actinophytocola sp. NPDC049390]|uniref:hypothetical protein n=1 Tax=Actinophytocola sp. NPDC049390 TaxID=3363894 RepID=UPI0037BB8C3E